jgi:hypothetical protein
MAGRSIVDRVELLEKRVDSFETLPAKVDALTVKVDSLASQFQQHQRQSAIEHSAIRDDIAHMHEVAMSRPLDLDDRMGKGFDRVDGRFNAVDRRFDSMDQGFDAMNQRVEQLEQRTIEGFDRIERLLTRPRPRRRKPKKGS